MLSWVSTLRRKINYLILPPVENWKCLTFFFALFLMSSSSGRGYLMMLMGFERLTWSDCNTNMGRNDPRRKRPKIEAVIVVLSLASVVTYTSVGFKNVSWRPIVLLSYIGSLPPREGYTIVLFYSVYRIIIRQQ